MFPQISIKNKYRSHSQHANSISDTKQIVRLGIRGVKTSQLKHQFPTQYARTPKGHTNFSDASDIDNIMSKQSEVDDIAGQMLEKFQVIFQITELNVDIQLFSQFLLLCELSMLFSKNKLLQRSIQQLNERRKQQVLLETVLYFDYRVLYQMNTRIQQISPTMNKAWIRFITPSHQAGVHRIYWKDFLRFKQLYIDKIWSDSDLRMFLLILNQVNPHYLIALLQCTTQEINKLILQLDQKQMQEIVFNGLCL